LLLSNIVVGRDARLQLGELVPASSNADMANFISFDVYDIGLSKVMNDLNLNLFCYKRRASLSLLWKTSIGF